MAIAVPQEVLRAYGLEEARVEPIAIGLINKTFRAVSPKAQVIIQRLHPIFDPVVNEDIDLITARLESKGLDTPRVVRTLDDKLWVSHDGIWRALTLVEGNVVEKVTGPDLAFSAGRLVGEFHSALDGFVHRFRFTRPRVHDTAYEFQRLKDALTDCLDDYGVAEIAPEILNTPIASFESFPQRIVHGDLKISNLIFDPVTDEAVSLIDLDTMRHGSVAVDLGDALRSWSNPNREGSGDVKCESSIVEAALLGYAKGSDGLLDPAEGRAVIEALGTITIELAARFATDAIEDVYFGWDSERFASRRAHNLARARSQIALARSIADQRGVLFEIATQALG